jgi:hypothetical protein
LCCTAMSSWTRMAIYPNEMVPLQIDLAIDADGTWSVARLSPGDRARAERLVS